MKKLQSNGFRALLATTGASGLALAEATTPDLVLLDIMLPDYDGRTILSELRARWEFPVIFLTGVSEETDRVVGLELGAADYITKPFSLSELVARVRAALRRREDQQPSFAATSFVKPEALLAQLHFSHLREEVGRFLVTNPFDANVFLMMPYVSTPQFWEIEQRLKTALERQGFQGHAARDKDLMPNLEDNTCAYMVACRYGVAVFEGVTGDAFNPNVSFELGFMFAWGRRCLLLKDASLKQMPADLCGKLYREFDSDNLVTLERVVGAWAADLR